MAAEPVASSAELASAAAASGEDRGAPVESEALARRPLDGPVTFFGIEGESGARTELIAEGQFAGRRYTHSHIGDVYWGDFLIAQDVASPPIVWRTPGGPRLVMASDGLVGGPMGGLVLAFNGAETEVLASRLGSAGLFKPAGERLFFIGAKQGGVMGVHVTTSRGQHTCLTNCSLLAGNGDLGTPFPLTVDALVVDEARARVTWRAQDGRTYGARFEMPQ